MDREVRQGQERVEQGVQPCACGKPHGDPSHGVTDARPHEPPESLHPAVISITDSRGKSLSFAVPDSFAHSLAISLTFGATANGGFYGVSRLPCPPVPGGGDVPSVLGSPRYEGRVRGDAERGSTGE